MADEKDAFYVVRKGNNVGVYKSISDLQAVLRSSVNDPSVSVFKGYGLSREAEQYVSSHGLKNAIYSIDAGNVQDDLFGKVVACPFRDMKGRNAGTCHSCRSDGHYFNECPRRRRCPRCAHGFQKCFEVERQTCNNGRLFNTCSNKCGFFEWVELGEFSRESSTINEALNVAANEKVEDLPKMFETLARISDERDLEINLNITFRKGKGRSEGNRKAKEAT
ncbi:Glycerol-3-phosphate dehydrogenase [NAD(+)] GPDHC1, cytosolic [Olea europaea subsp. europaea]|uniref:Glycerol-3-phosphate dehydrogenase [NAD(+)] GPDHC1, cytosolic n=1 Tax=Olea europaea subsp. europaea TaxID=158383 RepID=A0A8S0SPL5_OLEEU|nr:Glycerol-3-phosphate dehydrogenase [NAD(+)] GPDHC1, cytosolic [Olea europaea subsp. europaea]